MSISENATSRKPIIDISIDRVCFRLAIVITCRLYLKKKSYLIKGTSYEILVLIAYAQTPPLNAHTGVFNKARNLNFAFESSSTSTICGCKQQML